MREELERQKALAEEAATAGEEYSVESHVEAELLQRLTGTEKKRGCVVPGMGGEFLRPAKPRGGARTAAATSEQIEAVVAARTEEIEARLKAEAEARNAEAEARNSEVENRLKQLERLLMERLHMPVQLPDGAPPPVVTPQPTPTPTQGLTQLMIESEPSSEQHQPVDQPPATKKQRKTKSLFSLR